MKLLLIDYLSPKGHIKFDSIHIQALIELGYELHLVGRKGQFPGFVENDCIKITELPERFYKNRRFAQLSSRVKGLQCLFWINKHISLEDYDKVILLSYDILSLFFIKFKGKVLLINHNNVDQLDSKVKLFLTRNLPKNYQHVALNEYMEGKIKELLPRRIIHYIPHGYLATSISRVKPSNLREEEKFFFCPVNRNFDIKIVNRLLTSKPFKEWLMLNSISFYVKKQLQSVSQGNIKVIGRLSDEEYNYMLSKAQAVILPYGDEFKYRCSGIFFECVAANTPVIASDIPGMRIYEKDMNMYFFNDDLSLINKCRIAIEKGRTTNNVEQFNPGPYWEEILQDA